MLLCSWSDVSDIVGLKNQHPSKRQVYEEILLMETVVSMIQYVTLHVNIDLKRYQAGQRS